MKSKLSLICNVPLGAGRLNLKPVMGWQFNVTGVTGGKWRVTRLIVTCLVTCHLSLVASYEALANPTGMTVASGTATAAQSGPQLTITVSQNAFLNWQSFNIAANETTIFNQPSITSMVVNRINDPNPSQIFGSLQANGIVVLMNSAGFYFGPNSYVRTGGLIVSTANCIPPQNTGGSWEFNGPPPLSSIVNFGKIDVGPGGSAYLIAENVLNYGSISAPGGEIGLAAGQQVVLSDRSDGRGLSMEVNLPDGSVDNYGHIIADAGTIAMSARTVNQDGFVQANSVRDENGVIELVASDSLNLGANSQVTANGDASAAGSSGGSVTLQSGNTFSDATGSRIDVTGGSRGGNGGNVEISAPDVLSLNSVISARAQAGWTAGRLLLDPDYIILDTSGSDSAGSGTVLAGDPPPSGDTLDLNVNTAFANLAVSDIILQAVNDITLAGGTSWDLSGTIGANFGGVTSGQVTLEAGRNIIFGDGSLISDANNWSLTLMAGVNNFTTGTVQPGVGSIFLNGGPGLGGSGSIQMGSGNGISPAVHLVAGQDITVGSGYVITTGGGGISAHALAGNIDTGSDAVGYVFESAVSSLDQAYDLSGGLGGISTGAGGDVTLIAGGNVTSVSPAVNGYFYDGQFQSANNSDFTTAGAGAYGSTPGNVTIVAGGNVTGHYLAANGIGSIFAGVKMDANGDPITDVSGNYVLGASGSAGTSQSNPNLSLSLISGGWNVAAAQNILLQEVNNPNGVFDTIAGAAFNHYFDYAPGDYVNLSAGNLVQLGAPTASLPRATGLAIPFIYPSILNITAGDGGVTLGTPGSPGNLILFPSPQGSLTINTLGSLIGNLSANQGAPQIFNLIVSDSGSSQYRSSSSFGLNDHAATPVHLNSPTPLELNVGGDMDYVLLDAPEAAQISVGGNMNNSRFQGMNLSSDPAFQVQILEADGSTRTVTVDPAVTSINVAGDIYDRSIFTDLEGVTPAEAADLIYLTQAYNTSIPGTTLATSFYYNPATQTLTYQNINGVTLLNVLNLLDNFTYQVTINGVPQWSDPYDTIPLTQTVSVLGDPATPGTVAYALLNQYNQLGAIPNNSTASGFIIGGGGQFDITARSIDLGTSAGILSKGVGLYKTGSSYPLASLFGDGGVFDNGANISITTTGNHSADGDLIGNANSDLYVNSGDLVGDLDMFSSAIATLNGGNVSINVGGDANAGSSVISVNTLGVRGIYTTAQGDISVMAKGDVNVNGSRIAAYDGGNVTVESLNGSINAGTGASLPVAVLGYYEDPVTHAVYSTNPQIPFSGILALTFPARDALYPAPAATLGNILVEAPNGSVNANAAGVLQISLNNLNYPDATTTVLAGYELRDNMGNPVSAADLADGTPVLVSAGRDIDASGSGIIAGNANLDASGDINGLIFARDNININAQQNINVTAFGQGNVNVSSSGGTISGTIIGVGAVSVSGSSIDASLISANVSGTTSGQSGLGQGTAANATSQGLANNESTQAAAASDQGADDEKKKKGKQIALAQKVSRVTVILPPKNVSETKTPNPGT
jgi:filamentous hemagglutinin family protein